MKYIVLVLKVIGDQPININQLPSSGTVIGSSRTILGLNPMTHDEAIQCSQGYNNKENSVPSGTWAVVVGEDEEVAAGTVVNVQDFCVVN